MKCTTVHRGGGSWTRVRFRAFCTAWGPVRDSISTEFRYHTLQAARHQGTQHEHVQQRRAIDNGALGLWTTRMFVWPTPGARAPLLPKMWRENDLGTHLPKGPRRE